MSLKIGIVGTGNVCRKNYVPWLAQEENVELGYFNRTQSKADDMAEEFGGKVFDSLDALTDWGPDSVLVLTKETDRFEAAMALLDRGPKRVFFEKPLTAKAGQANVAEQDFFDGKAIMDKAAEKKCDTAMVFNYRFFDQSALAKRLVAERNFGSPVNVTGLVHYACWSHAIDLVHFFAGPIAEICAVASEKARGAGGFEAKDTTSAFRTEGGATGTIIGTSGMSFDFPLFELTFSFEGGRVHMRDLDGDLEVLDYSTKRHEVYTISRTVSRWDQYAASFKKSLVAYLESIRQGTTPPVPGEWGLRELQVEAGMKRSIAEGRPVKLSEELPLS